MASLALGALGAGLGSIYGGTQGAMLGWSVGTIVGGILFPPSIGDQSTGKLDDLRLTGAGFGSAIPQVFGKHRVGGNIIWVNTDASGNMLVEHYTDQRQGGKGPLAGGASSRTYTYSATFAVALCRGQLTAVNKIWAEGEVIYDASAGTPTKYDIRFKFGTPTQTPESGMESLMGTGNTPAYRDMAYVVFYDIDLSTWGNRLPQLSFEVDAGAATVGSILADVFGQIGLAPSDYDVTSATDSVRGWMISSRTEARQAIESLLRFYQTDLAEIDGKIVAIRRGTTSSLTIPYSDLGATEDDTDDPIVQQTRRQDIELPRRIDLTYFDTTNAYAQGSQGAVRQTKVWMQDSITEDTALALNPDEARQGAERELYSAWNERSDISISLSQKYFDIAPGRVITVSLPTGDFIGRVIEVAGNTAFKVKLVKDDSSVITQSVVGGAGTGLTRIVEAVIPTTFYAWSGVEVRDEDTFQAGFYVVGTGPDGWRGATIYYSQDNTNYSPVGTLRDRGEFGTCNTTLGNAANNTSWDGTNTVDVTLQVQGQLVSDSQNNVLYNTGANKAIIGSEIIGYATATIVSGLRYTLSTLRRGYRSTPFTGHVASEKWVHLTTAIVRIPVPASLIGQTIYVKCLSPGQSLGAVTAQSFVVVAPNTVYPTTTGVATTAQGSVAHKLPCRAVATSNITLSGTQTVDGVALIAGDRCLAAGQTTGSQNGPWIVAAGAWSRAPDADTSAEVFAGINMFITEGTHADELWQLSTNGAIVLGTTSLTFTKYPTSSGSTTTPFYRMRGMVRSGTGVLLDSTYFDQFGVHSNTVGTIRYWRHSVGTDVGSFTWNQATNYYFWGRIGIQNTTGSDITLPIIIAGHDDSLVVLLEHPDNLTGTVGTSPGHINGTGTQFLTDFNNAGGDYAIVNGELIRTTSVSSNTDMPIANTPSGLVIGLAFIRKALKVYEATGPTEPNTAVNLVIKANKTMVLHVLHNSNGQPNFSNVIFLDEGIKTTGIQFVDPGA